MWALLPVVARSHLGLNSGGYGLLLGAVGLGAVIGAWTLPRARARYTLDRVVMAASVAFGGAALVLAWVESEPLVAAALVVTGYCWIAVLSSLNASIQSVLPEWVRARGMGIYLLVFQGGQALGAVVWGALAARTDTSVSLTVVAGGLALTVLVARRWPLLTGAIDVRPSQSWAEPELAIQPEPSQGPVLVTIEYDVPIEHWGEFREAMQRVGRSRRRSGAERWGLFQDTADPDRFTEAFVVPTWVEHVRQYQERLTRSDQQYEDRARALTRNGDAPQIRQMLAAR
jgi:MFS family permease